MEATKVPETAQAGEQQQAPAFQAPKKKRKWPKRLLIAALIAGAVFFFVIRPMLGAGQQMLAGMYQAEAAQVRDMTVTVSSTGTVTPIDSYRVNSLVTGEVLEAPFEEGGWVEKGALLYRIDMGDAQTALEQAQLSVRQAQLSYDTLVKNLTPTASAAGVVQTVHVAKGDLVNAGSPIADITDTSTMTITLPFLSADAVQIWVGAAATVTMDGTGETLSGTVEKISTADLVGAGGALIRQVEIRVNNPGALTAQATATATVGAVSCAGSGSFQANRSQTVVAMTSGEVTELHITAGTKVSAGTALATLGGSNVSDSLENAALALENAQLSLKRSQDALDNYVITAPISGEVIEKNFKVGDKLDNNSLTAAGGNLAVIYDMSSLTFEMRIAELDINKIEEGQPVSITASAVEGEVFSGYVDKVNLNGTTQSGMTNYPITVQITDPGALKPGMNVSADVIVDKVGQVLCVPVEAVKRGGESPYVQVIAPEGLDENGNVKDLSLIQRRDVALGSNDEQYIQITEGLSEGEIVVWENQASNPLAMMMG